MLTLIDFLAGSIFQAHNVRNTHKLIVLAVDVVHHLIIQSPHADLDGVRRFHRKYTTSPNIILNASSQD
jgi:hypothetical protein